MFWRNKNNIRILISEMNELAILEAVHDLETRSIFKTVPKYRESQIEIFKLELSKRDKKIII